MYVDISRVRSGKKEYTRVLLRESYREGGKVKHRTIANLSGCSEEELEAIKLALKHKKDLSKLKEELGAKGEEIKICQGSSVGAIGVLEGIARELGIVEALGNSRQGKLALWQVIARALDQGSRLSAVRLAGGHACCDLLGLDAFNEDDLYENLDWLAKNQERIEGVLLKRRYGQKKPTLFLYDVTSSYLEGEHNAFAAFGYNRDGKRGKKQIVVGLLCDEAGKVLSVEVFAGNTGDTQTVSSQIQKVAERFGGGEVCFVGDRGMIKGPQIESLIQEGFHYITAITKPQIAKLLSQNVLQMELFDQTLSEVIDEQARYILRRNPKRTEEIRACRASKRACVDEKVKQMNAYLAQHPRATVARALKVLKSEIEKLKLSSWLHVVVDTSLERSLHLEIDQEALCKEEELDGCYVIKTDLTPTQATKEVVHARYKSLAFVEQAFRISKTAELEMRPIYVRNPNSTRGHALVVMLAYCIVQELANRWQDIDLTVQEALDQLSSLCCMQILVNNQSRGNTIPEPNELLALLLHRSGVLLPKALPSRGSKVATRTKLPQNRTTRSK